ncbi:MAG: hypothetical protein KAX49_14025 [Halanaerobiales bacterium]|nr:hypothetical protein [Halanaerobiales bacterium]
MSNKHNLRKLRQLAIQRLGGRCADCEIDDEEVLVFDHKNNDGYKERREISSYIYHKRLYEGILEDRREDIQLLCANCNMKKVKREKEWNNGLKDKKEDGS